MRTDVKPRKEKKQSVDGSQPAVLKQPVVLSMTGYGRASVDEGEARRVTAEIRAVNNRYLKLGVKVAGRYGALEDRVKTILNELGIKRGSIDVSLYFENASEEGSFGINAAAVTHYLAQARAIAKKQKIKGDIPLSALLPLPGVIKREELSDDIEAAWTVAKKAVLAAINDFNAMRAKEGQAMVADIRSQLKLLADHRTAIDQAAPEALANSIQKFKDRITKLLEQAKIEGGLKPDALEREIVMLTDRTDISEELARLNSHFEQMESTLQGGGETGKKLEFLAQELLRETNTIGSKTQDERVTYRVVAMKGLIEKIKEQVQNLE